MHAAKNLWKKGETGMYSVWYNQSLTWDTKETNDLGISLLLWTAIPVVAAYQW